MPVNGKPRKRKSPVVYFGQEINSPQHGEGIICLINILMQDGEETGREVIVRFRNDPPGHVRTFSLTNYYALRA